VSSSKAAGSREKGELVDDLEQLLNLVLGPELDPIRGAYARLARRIADIGAGIDFDLAELRTLRQGLGRRRPSVFLEDEIGSWRPGDALEVRQGEDSSTAETDARVALEALLTRSLTYFEQGLAELQAVRTLASELRQDLRGVLARLGDEAREVLRDEARKPRRENLGVLTHRELAGLRETFAFALPAHVRRGLHLLIAGSFADSDAVLEDDECGFFAVELRAVARDLQFSFDKLQGFGEGENVSAEEAELLVLARRVTHELAPALASLRGALGGMP